MKNRLIICSLMILIITIGCGKDDNADNPIYFIGDSQVSNWDTEYSFPNRVTKNWGKEGAKLLYLERLKDIDTNADIVIEIGTNDLQTSWAATMVEEYVEKYIEVVMSLPGRRKYVVEVFPTSNLNKNRVIQIFNYKLKEGIKQNDFVEIIEVYDKLESDGVLKDSFTRDGVHLNDYGYMVVTNEVNRII